MITRKYFFMPILFLLACACGKEKDNRTIDVANVPPDKYFNFNYKYPENVFKGRSFGGTDLEFYPVGISKNGLFAYMERVCVGGGRCNSFVLRIIELMSDKNIDAMNLEVDLDAEDIEPSVSDPQFQQMTAFLRRHGISQVDLPIDRNTKPVYNGHSYEVITETAAGTDDDEYLTNAALQYVIRVRLDDSRLKVVTKGKVSDGDAFSYLGYIKSPYQDQLVLLFNKSFYGWEREHFNEIVVSGCNLSPKYWGVPGY